MPKEVAFQIKPQIALVQLRQAIANGKPEGLRQRHGVSRRADRDGNCLHRRRAEFDCNVGARNHTVCRPDPGTTAAGRPSPHGHSAAT